MANLLDRITVNPDQCGGRPCIRGMRIRVGDALDLLEAGLSREQVPEELPGVQPEDITAASSLPRVWHQGHRRGVESKHIGGMIWRACCRSAPARAGNPSLALILERRENVPRSRFPLRPDLTVPDGAGHENAIASGNVAIRGRGGHNYTGGLRYTGGCGRASRGDVAPDFEAHTAEIHDRVSYNSGPKLRRGAARARVVAADGEAQSSDAGELARGGDVIISSSVPSRGVWGVRGRRPHAFCTGTPSVTMESPDCRALNGGVPRVLQTVP